MVGRRKSKGMAETISNNRQVKYWEIIADNLSKAGWRLGRVSTIDSEDRTIWIVDTHRGDGKRFVVRADEKPDGLVKAKNPVGMLNWRSGKRSTSSTILLAIVP